MKKLLLFCSIVLLLLFESVSVSAQIMPSFKLKAVVNSGPSIKFTWTKPRGTVSEYYVYKGLADSMFVQNSLSFSVIDSTHSDTTFTYTPAIAAPVTFVFYVQAKTDKGTVRSNAVDIHLAPPIDTVKITSTPAGHAQINILYTYQLTAASTNPSAKIRYAVIMGERGMTIDSTGLFKWTPQMPGVHPVSIEAMSNHGGKALQSFVISVAMGNGKVSGIVKNSSGDPVKNILVKLYQKDASNHLLYQAVTNTSGQYQITNVGPGNYYAQAISFNSTYLSQWYNGASSLSTATAIAVADSPAVAVVNFTLKSKSSVTSTATIQGAVTGTSNASLNHALVTFARADFALNSGKFKSADSGMAGGIRDMFDPNDSLSSRDFSLTSNSPFVTQVYTDASGNYSVKLTDGDYIATAITSGYYRQFYNGKSNILEANIIHVTKDTTGINFALTALPQVALGEIDGVVTDSTNSKGIPARIIAYRQFWTAHDTIPFFRNYFTDTDSTGVYSLQSLPPGTYRIMAVPMGNYAPAFYSTTGITNRWKLASTIVINGNTVTGVHIFVKPMSKAHSGYTYISGSVTSPNAPVTAGTIGKSMSNYPLNGTLVYAVDASGNVAGYAITDADGSYTIPGLSPDTYFITPDNPSYTTPTSITATPTYNQSGSPVPSVGVSFSVSLDQVVSIDETSNVPTSYVLNQNYPNPFNPSTTINFSIPQSGLVQVKIYNILGQEIATLINTELAAGNHSIKFDASRLPSGVYIYQLHAGSFIMNKKMVLLK